MFNCAITTGVLVVALFSVIGPTLTNPAAQSLQSDKPATSNRPAPAIGDLKVLAEGSQSSVQEPFVALCRDAETYEALKKLDKALPKLDRDFFQSHLVIAAYLGTRNTGGYRVIIKRQGEPDLPSPYRAYVRVHEEAPAKNTIVPQVITSPFSIVSLEVNGTPPLTLGLDYAWRQKQQPYRVKSGTFSMGGGFAGTHEQWEPHGELLALRARGFVSFYISLAGTSPNKERSLSDFVTGTMQKNEIAIKKMSTDVFVEGPNGGFSATGSFKDGDVKLSLMFGSLRSLVSDGYDGAGSLEAETARLPTTPKPTGIDKKLK
jgi:hypothetical protein